MFIIDSINNSGILIKYDTKELVYDSMSIDMLKSKYGFIEFEDVFNFLHGYHRRDYELNKKL